MKLVLRATLAYVLAVVTAGCLPIGQSATPAPDGSGPAPTSAPGSAGLTGTLTWTLNSRDSDPEHLNFRAQSQDTVTLTFAFNYDESVGWVDAGSTYTRNGTSSSDDDLCHKDRQWSGSGTFADSEGYLEVFVDEDAGMVGYDSLVEADMSGTATCDPTSFSQGGAEWVEIANCGRDMGNEVITGERHGVIGADGRTVTFDCTAVLDEVLNESGAVHEEWRVTGTLTLAP